MKRISIRTPRVYKIRETLTPVMINMYNHAPYRCRHRSGYTLLGMLIGFHFILLSQLIDERVDQLRLTQRVLGQDPGIRVLLRNRADKPAPAQRCAFKFYKHLFCTVPSYLGTLNIA